MLRMNEQMSESMDECNCFDATKRLQRDDLMQTLLHSTKEGKEAQRGCSRPPGESLVKAGRVPAVLDSATGPQSEGCSSALGSGGVGGRGGDVQAFEVSSGSLPVLRTIFPEAAVGQP